MQEYELSSNNCSACSPCASRRGRSRRSRGRSAAFKVRQDLRPERWARTRQRRQVEDAGARSRPAVGASVAVEGSVEPVGRPEPSERSGSVLRSQAPMRARSQIELLRVRELGGEATSASSEGSRRMRAWSSGATSA